MKSYNRNSLDKFEKYVKNGQLEKIKLLWGIRCVEYGYKNEAYGYTPLYTAIFYGNDKFCRKLLKWWIEVGFNVNLTNYFVDTPLHDVAREYYPLTSHLLIKSGANVNATNFSGLTPLHVAARYDRDKTCELLIRAGGNVNIENKCGETPLDTAVDRGYDKICQLLIKSGAKITTKIFEKLTEKCKELVVLYENEVDPKLTELTSKIKKREEEKKKILSLYFISDIVRFIGKY